MKVYRSLMLTNEDLIREESSCRFSSSDPTSEYHRKMTDTDGRSCCCKKYTPPKIDVRIATLSDLPRLIIIADIGMGSNAYVKDLFPRLEKFPDDFRRYVRDSLHGHLTNRKVRVVTASIQRWYQTWDGQTEELVGMAVWERVGNGSEKLSEGWPPYSWISKMIKASGHRFERDPNRDGARDFTAYSHLNKAQREFEECYYPIPERWHMRGIVVQETCRGMGVGTKLLEWGLSEAKKEGIPAAAETAISSGDASRIFRRLDFERISEVNPKILEKTMGTAMLWIPEGCVE